MTLKIHEHDEYYLETRRIDAQHIITLVHYQEVLIFVFGALVPVLYIGSSAELRKEIDLIRRYIIRTRTEQTQEIYTLYEMNIQ